MQHDALAPHFASQFQCTKSACPESCCGNLNVFLDQDTLDLYSTHPALIPLVQAHLINEENDTGSTGKVLLNKDPKTGTCPLLDTDSLCIMRRDFGEDTLPQICISYPRQTHWLGDDLLVTLSDSCPEVARLLIESPNAMDLDFKPFNLPDTMEIAAKSTDSIDPNRYHYLQSILTLLRHKEIPLELRLFIIGLYSERADTIINNPTDDPDALPKLTDLFFNLVNQGYFEEQAKNLQNPDKHSLGLVLLNELRTKGVKGSLREDVRNLLLTFELSYQDAFDEVHLARLNQADRRYLQPLISEHPEALENILANWLLTDLFPLREVSLNQGWLRLMLRYLLLKTLVSGTGLHQGKLTKEDLIRITYRFARSVSLSTTLQDLEAVLQARGLNTIATFTHALNL